MRGPFPQYRRRTRATGDADERRTSAGRERRQRALPAPSDRSDSQLSANSDVGTSKRRPGITQRKHNATPGVVTRRRSPSLSRCPRNEPPSDWRSVGVVKCAISWHRGPDGAQDVAPIPVWRRGAANHRAPGIIVIIPRSHGSFSPSSSRPTAFCRRGSIRAGLCAPVDGVGSLHVSPFSSRK